MRLSPADWARRCGSDMTVVVTLLSSTSLRSGVKLWVLPCAGLVLTSCDTVTLRALGFLDCSF